MKRRNGYLISTMLLLAVLAIPSVALAQNSDASEGVLVRVKGDATIEAGEEAGIVVVVGGDLTMRGTAKTVVVVDGKANIDGATIETLVVVRGEVSLANGATVSGDIYIPNSDIDDDGSVEVSGDVVRNYADFAAAFAFFGIIFIIGAGVASILSVLLMAGVAPGLVRRAEDVILEDFGKVALAGVFFWIVLPIAAVLLLLTIVGMPTAFAVWFVVMPALAFVGYLVSAILIGHWIVDKDRSASHPYAAGAVGALIIMAANFVPFVGGLLGTTAALVGAAALALLAWRSFRSTEPATAV
jgi:hypothetical protein